MKIFFVYLCEKLSLILLFAVFCGVFLAVSLLGGLPVRLGLYGMLLCFSIGAVSLIVGFFKFKRKHDQLLRLLDMTVISPELLPEGKTLTERDYLSIIKAVADYRAADISAADKKYSALYDYFTVWAHQIKTPISAMHLLLQGKDDDYAIKRELFSIEQYVEMVLQYLRTDSDYTDYVIAPVSLDAVIRSSVKKFASQFIYRRISLQYEPVCASVLSDEKWLSFVVEQLISNALKYTPEGSVTITFNNGKLSIKDTGIGIAPEDLPRVFDSSFTGYNGRRDKKSTGIGMYLCKKVCTRLGHSIYVESELHKGTTVCIDLSEKETVFE